MLPFSRFLVSSLRRGHANLLCIVTNLSCVLRGLEMITKRSAPINVGLSSSLLWIRAWRIVFASSQPKFESSPLTQTNLHYQLATTLWYYWTYLGRLDSTCLQGRVRTNWAHLLGRILPFFFFFFFLFCLEWMFPSSISAMRTTLNSTKLLLCNGGIVSKAFLMVSTISSLVGSTLFRKTTLRLWTDKYWSTPWSFLSNLIMLWQIACMSWVSTRDSEPMASLWPKCSTSAKAVTLQSSNLSLSQSKTHGSTLMEEGSYDPISLVRTR